MRLTVTRALLSFGLIVLMPGLAFTASTGSGISDEHREIAHETCMDSTGNQAYCDCAVDAAHASLAAEHVYVDEKGEFRLSPDLPREVGATLHTADANCRQEHLPADANRPATPHDDDVLEAVYVECMEANQHEEFCRCSQAHFEWHVPAEQVNRNSDGTPAGLKDPAGEHMDKLVAAVNTCREIHLHSASEEIRGSE